MKTILVAEDREASRELIRTVLEACGYRVIEACDGREALLRAQEMQADLVILDLYMPHASGFEVLLQLRLRDGYRETPVIALTASAMSGDRERAIAAGFSDFISKPVNLKALRLEIARLLESGKA